jgi:hypothetical protein
MGGPFAVGLLGAGISAASALASGFGESIWIKKLG